MYLGQKGIYSFHSLELKKANEKELSEILAACEKVESRVWCASENFYDYIKKQTALFYAKAGNEVVAFALFDVTLKDKTLIVAANECMVIPEHQGQGLPNIFVSILISHIRFERRLKSLKRCYENVVFLSLTVNFKMMSAFRKFSFLAQSSSFAPCDEVHAIAKEYLKVEGLVTIEGHPFFAKGAFPDSLKAAPKVVVPGFVPKEFDITRGDGLVYVCKTDSFLLLGLVAWLVQYRADFKFNLDLKKRFNLNRRVAAKEVIYS